VDICQNNENRLTCVTVISEDKGAFFETRCSSSVAGGGGGGSSSSSAAVVVVVPMVTSCTCPVCDGES